MNVSRWLRCAVVAAAITAPPFTSVATRASADDRDDGGKAVFVQTNDPTGNAIVAYQRHHDGTLARRAVFATGGRGGRAAGSSSDPLASQGSLVFDRGRSLLFAVNAGSDSLSVFNADGWRLHRRQVIGSGGKFPVSIAVHGDLVFVLNAGGAAGVSGFRLDDGRLHHIAGASRSLGLPESNPPAFLQSPAQVGFTPDGDWLLVTGKTNNFIDAFRVSDDGGLPGTPVKSIDSSVPFAFLFSPSDQLDLVNAAGNLAPSEVGDHGVIRPEGQPVSDGQVAACWIAVAGDFAFVANTGSNNVSEYRLGDEGRVRLVNATAATGIAGPTDEATADGRFLYVLSGLTSTVDVYSIGDDGRLRWLQSATVPDGASQEGVAAS